MTQAGHNRHSLAEASGAKQPNIFRILEGESEEPRSKTIQPLADYFGVTVEELKYKDLTGLKRGANDMRDMQDGADVRTSRAAGDLGEVRHINRRGEVVESEAVTVRISDASASMGIGIPMLDHEQSVASMQLSKTWIQGHLPKISSIESLAILTAYGDSMMPTFNDGDLLLVDRGIGQIDIDGVFVLNRNSELFVKRVRRRFSDGAIIIKSDNPLFGEDIVENGDKERLAVLGRVVWAWAGKKL